MNTIHHSYCNNCEKTGHTFSNCRKPLVSHGIITYRINSENQLEYLLVCRKHTFGYIDFLRGKYSINNKSHIMHMMNEMTEKEKLAIRNKSFIENWLELWGSQKNTYFINEKIFANEKFNQLTKGVVVSNEKYTIQSLLNECTQNWETPEWGFPKGRRNYQENDLTCGLREFEEETGHDRGKISVIKNLVPFEETFVGSNLKSYKHVYFLGLMNVIDKNENEMYQKSEVSEMKWFSLEECVDKIRDYNVEKIDMITKINKLLKKYKLIT